MCLQGWRVAIKSRCALHTVMSNIHIVGQQDSNSIGVLFEGKISSLLVVDHLRVKIASVLGCQM